MIEKVKEVRVSIDALIQVTGNLGSWTDEVKEAVRSLKLGKMWLGKALGQMGDETPYKQGNDVSNNIIDPKADVAILLEERFSDIDVTNQIQLAKKLREEIDKEIAELGGMFAFNNTSTDMGMFVNEARINLSEARMWLGEYLNFLKIRNESSEATLLEDAQEYYEAYISVALLTSAPGTKFDKWADLPPSQKDAWKAVANVQPWKHSGANKSVQS